MKTTTQGVFQILDYLMEGRNFKYTEKDIYESAGVSKRDTALALNVLPKLGLVTKKKGTYQFRKNTTEGKVFLKFFDAVINEICETYNLRTPKEIAKLLKKNEKEGKRK